MKKIFLVSLLLFTYNLFSDTSTTVGDWRRFQDIDPIYDTYEFSYDKKIYEDNLDKAYFMSINLIENNDHSGAKLYFNFFFFELQNNPPKTCIIRYEDNEPNTYVVEPGDYGMMITIQDPNTFISKGKLGKYKGILRYQINNQDVDVYFDYSDIVDQLSSDMMTISLNSDS